MRIAGETAEQALLEQGAEEAHADRQAEQFKLADFTAVVFEKYELRAGDFDLHAVDESFRCDDMRQLHDHAGVAEVDRPGRPVQHDRQFARQVQPEKGEIAGYRSWKQESDVFGG